MATPADELRQAAATLRKLASKATQGPWVVDSYPFNRCGITGSNAIVVEPVGEEDDGEAVRDTDAHWIALMSPEVAEPLASWLDGEANRGDWHAEHPRAAFMFARLVNQKVPG